MKPASTVSTQTLSKVAANFASASLSSSLARCERPRVQAKIEAIELVEVSLALLELAIVTGHRAMRGLGFHRPTVGGQEDARHQPERSEPLRDRIRLHVAVVILAGPDIAARPLERRGHHVVDQTMLVCEPERRILRLELGLVDFLENVLEAAVIDFQDRVLGGEIDRYLRKMP